MSILFLNTHFPNRLILASSPLTETTEHIRKGEENGAGGAILKTCCHYARAKDYEQRKVLFTSDQNSYYASSSFEREILTAEEGLVLYRNAVKTCSIPVIPSITAFSLEIEDWLPLCLDFQNIGASILQLDLFYLGTLLSQHHFSEKFFALLDTLTHSLSCQIMPKLNIDLPAEYIIPIISKAGVKGVSLLDSVRIPVTDPSISTNLPFSTTSLFGAWQFPLSLRYTYIAHQYGLAVCGGGGITDRSSVMHLIAAGADLVQTASAILLNGYPYLSQLQPEEKGNKTVHQSVFPSAYQIDKSHCSHCRRCLQSTWCDAVSADTDGVPIINHELCDACGWCAARCPTGAIRAKGHPVLQDL